MTQQFVTDRYTVYSDVTPIGAATYSATTTVVSDEMAPYENSAYGEAIVTITAADASEISSAEDIDVKSEVSFDEGETWLLMSTDDDVITNGSGTISEINTLTFAPRVRVTSTATATAVVSAGLNFNVYTEMHENYVGYTRTFLSDTEADFHDGAGNAVTEVDTGDTFYTKTQNVDNLQVLQSYFIAADSGDIDDGDLTVTLQSSYDGTVWWNAGAGSILLLANKNTDNLIYSTSVFEDGGLDAGAGVRLGNYFRYKVVSTASTGGTFNINSNDPGIALYHVALTR